MIATTVRNANLEDLAKLLHDQHARQLDVVAPATALRSRGGLLQIDGTAEPVLTADGVTTSTGAYRPTDIFDEGVADKLGIGVKYVRQLRDGGRTDLIDANINGLLHGRKVNRGGQVETVHPADDRSFLVRCFRGDGDGVGIARALLSNTYRPIDNLDVLMAALDGARTASQRSGQPIEVVSCDLTERRMTVKITAPTITAQAPNLFAGYRSPFNNADLDRARRFSGGRDYGRAPDGSPIVFAGLVISNSETGHGAYTLVPQVVALVCSNGMTVKRDAMKAVHLGSKLEDGVIEWSEDTKRKQVELVRAKTADAVEKFLSPGYLSRIVAEIERQAGAELTAPAEAVEVLGKRLQFTKDERAGILEHFTRGGQMTAGGFVNAITSYAQTVADADRANELEETALPALAAAATYRPTD